MEYDWMLLVMFSPKAYMWKKYVLAAFVCTWQYCLDVLMLFTRHEHGKSGKYGWASNFQLVIVVGRLR